MEEPFLRITHLSTPSFRSSTPTPTNLRYPTPPFFTLATYNRFAKRKLWFAASRSPRIDRLCLPPPTQPEEELPDMHQNASTTVFAIPELAENILLQLGALESRSWKQLYVIQRVNSTFQSLIRESLDLRKCMNLEHPDSRQTPLKFKEALESYKKFFYSVEDVMYPFWCHLRPINTPPTIILSLNVSLFWSEELPGVMAGQLPGTLDGSTPIEQNESWRRILVPHHPEHLIELHCCGYDVMAKFERTTTLGQLADEAIKAGRCHLGGLERVLFYGDSSCELGL